MKKIIINGLVLFVIIILGWAILFTYKNIRGIKPVFLPTPGSIASELKQNQGIMKSGENTTGLPIIIPNGFSISIYAKNLGNPRVFTRDKSGNLLVSIPARGTVVALPDKNADFVSDETVLVATGLNKPHGLTFKENILYIAETNQIATFDYNAVTLAATNKKKIIDLSAGGNHFSRTVAFGPDGKLYITVGSTCNVCIENNAQRASMLFSNPDGSGLARYASGLRNSVFFVWHPVTGMLWATEMGRDLLGDNIPPDEINIIDNGKYYGWPYCYGKNVHDKKFDNSISASNRCKNSQASYIDIPAHSAPLGLAFVPANSSWPKDYWYNLLVSYHGSWNRTTPTGYKVVRYKLDDRGVYQGEEDFISGWLTHDGALGRPVDLNFDSVGNFFISDDKAGLIYIMRPALN